MISISRTQFSSDPAHHSKGAPIYTSQHEAAKAILREKVLSTIGSLNPQMDALKARE